MSYTHAVDTLTSLPGIEEATMMGTPCLRYNGAFIGMMFDKADALIIKVSALRVEALIEEGIGLEFNFTKKRFKEWVMIPLDFEDGYLAYLTEAMEHAKSSG